MALSIDKAFGIHQYALQLRSHRGELLASNLVNADTPGYQAKDFDFQAALDQVSGGGGAGRMATTHAAHFVASGASPLGVTLQYRLPIEPSVDGNTVDEHMEKTRFAENAMRYQASLGFLDDNIKGLVRAIRGE